MAVQGMALFYIRPELEYASQVSLSKPVRNVKTQISTETIVPQDKDRELMKKDLSYRSLYERLSPISHVVLFSIALYRTIDTVMRSF